MSLGREPQVPGLKLESAPEGRQIHRLDLTDELNTVSRPFRTQPHFLEPAGLRGGSQSTNSVAIHPSR